MPRKERVQVLLTEQERERFRLHALASGTSLSNWMRRAGLSQAERAEKRDRLDTVEELEAFFVACDRLEDGGGAEPDWEQTRGVIGESRRRGLPDA